MSGEFDIEGAARWGRKRGLDMVERATYAMSRPGKKRFMQVSPAEFLALVAAIAEGDEEFRSALGPRTLEVLEALSVQLKFWERL